MASAGDQAQGEDAHDRRRGAVAGFFHAGVTVRDMDRSLTFYRDALGLELRSLGLTGGPQASQIWKMEVGPVRVAFLGVPGSDALVELFEFQEIERHPASARPCDYGAGHFCLYVDDAEAAHRRIVEHGFSSRGGRPVEILRGPHAGAKAVYTIDPDGYHVELFELAPAKRDGDAPTAADALAPADGDGDRDGDAPTAPDGQRRSTGEAEQGSRGG
ncbi:MAG: VOC family protein [Solirubrobacteraceae bacterium]